MARKKDERDVEVEDGREFAARTIVGGRPRRPRSVRMNIPAGIEKMLYKAAVDRDFRAALLDDRMGTVRAHGLRLTEVERTMLETIPDARLELIIDRVQPERRGKRRFMRAVASAVVTLATGTAVVACDESVKGATAGIPPDTAVEPDAGDADDPADDPADVPDGDDVTVDTSTDVVDGILPDVPEDPGEGLDAGDIVHDTDIPESWGILPDVPPDPEEG